MFNPNDITEIRMYEGRSRQFILSEGSFHWSEVRYEYSQKAWREYMMRDFGIITTDVETFLTHLENNLEDLAEKLDNRVVVALNHVQEWMDFYENNSRSYRYTNRFVVNAKQHWYPDADDLINAIQGVIYASGKPVCSDELAELVREHFTDELVLEAKHEYLNDYIYYYGAEWCQNLEKDDPYQKYVDRVWDSSQVGLYGRSGGWFSWALAPDLSDLEGTLNYIRKLLHHDIKTLGIEAYLDALVNYQEIMEDVSEAKKDYVAFKELLDYFTEVSASLEEDFPDYFFGIHLPHFMDWKGLKRPSEHISECYKMMNAPVDQDTTISVNYEWAKQEVTKMYLACEGWIDYRGTDVERMYDELIKLKARLVNAPHLLQPVLLVDGNQGIYTATQYARKIDTNSTWFKKAYNMANIDVVLALHLHQFVSDPDNIGDDAYEDDVLSLYDIGIFIDGIYHTVEENEEGVWATPYVAQMFM